MSTLQLVPVDWSDVRDFVTEWHRHHRPPQGHKFSVGVADGSTLVGVAAVGRPVSRARQDGRTLEVTRLATDGTSNACSMLYAACWRATKALGYRRLGTYTRVDESGASLRAAGWHVVAELQPRKGWDAPSRRRSNDDYDAVGRLLWEAV